MSEREEVLLEPGFVLHQRLWRNSSLIVECLTARYGRLGLVAQGARRAGSRQRSSLEPFQRVRLSWVRRGELGRLTAIETEAAQAGLGGDGLLAGFYLNELVLRLVPRGDQNEAILSCYSSCLDRLAEPRNAARALRLFELGLLEAMGFGIDLKRDYRTGEPIVPGREYVYEHEGGLTASGANATMEGFSGEHLISLGEQRLDDAQSLKSAKRLLGGILAPHLGDRPLEVRRVIRDIVDLGFSRR